MLKNFVIGSILLLFFCKSSFSQAVKINKLSNNKETYEKMEMLIGDYRIFTHRPGGIKIRRLSDNTEFYVSTHPNAGLPNAFGEYDQTPKEMLNQIRVYLKENLINIVGGCCGTTYEHIRLIAEEVKKYKPRKVK